ncbi:bifunctional 5,10-methylenetetrahydrofolate dehydrogenase/5,10-methenyltetrahydrofolate cyclohydrolase [Planctomycetota bacterium]
MTEKKINGSKIARKIRKVLAAELATMKDWGISLHLVAVELGRNPAAEMYARYQRKACEKIGIHYTLQRLPEDTSEAVLIAEIHRLNADPGVTGIMVQLPLPGIDRRKVQAAISPHKDVEGINPINLGLLVYGEPNLAPCTAMGVLELIHATGLDLDGKEAVIVGRSEIVGKPIGLLMLKKMAVTIVGSKLTRDLPFYTSRADVLVVAAGKPGLITGDMVKPGAIVIDVGINVIEVTAENGKRDLDQNGNPKTRVVGDVNYDEVAQVAGFITPVPGGVGPITVTMLLKNVVEAAKIGLSANKLPLSTLMSWAK